jgi:predicted GNAT family N-acyltransferase
MVEGITTCIVAVTDPEYKEVFALRDEVLRKPLGQSLYNDDLSRDYTDAILVAKHDNKVIACLMLHHINTNEVQLRQMAVYNRWQGQGVGKLLVQFAEDYAFSKGYTKVILHARMVAVGFYAGMGYVQYGNEFVEVGIPHFMMEKIIGV